MLIIFWDFDGTLANSEKKFYLILKQYIVDKIPKVIINIEKFTEQFYYQFCSGKKFYQDFEILGEEGIIDYSKVTQDDLSNFLDYLTQELKDVKEGEITLTKGMDELLLKLSKIEKIKMVIDTNARKSDLYYKSQPLKNEIINEMIKNNNIYAAPELSDDLEYLEIEKYKGKTKPNPAVFIYTIEDLKKNNAEIGNIIIVEDSSSAVAGGRNFVMSEYAKNKLKDSKIKIVGYTAGDHKPDGKRLSESGADIIIDNADKLYNFIMDNL